MMMMGRLEVSGQDTGEWAGFVLVSRIRVSGQDTCVWVGYR